jgi:tripartite-type tricarboxylate transporter receptor subunit TctC
MAAMKTRHLLCLSLAALAGLTTGAAAAAYPDKPIRFVVGLAPGGGVDFTARTLAARLAAAFGQQVVVDNRPGAGGSIAAAIVARSAADGYTMLLGSRSNFVIDPLINPNVGYDPRRDLAPVSMATSQSMVLVVHPSVAAKNIAELIALAKAQPGKLAYASGGTGTGTHLAGELFAKMAGVSLVHVPYKGGSQSMIDLIAGQIQLIFQSLPAALPHIKANRIRALAVTTTKRAVLLPELPTVAESGLPGFEADNWYGIAVAAKTPRPLVQTLNREIVAALNHTEVRPALVNQGLDPAPTTPEAFAAHINGELARWGKLAIDIGLKPQ